MKTTPKQQSEITIAQLNFLFGSYKTSAITVVIAFMFLFSWVTSASYDWLVLFFKQTYHLDEWQIYAGFIGIFIVFLLVLVFGVSHSLSKLKVIVKQDNPPAKIEGLILYLSPFKKGATADEAQQLAEQLSTYEGMLKDEAFRAEHLNNSWRMPFEAIAYHLVDLQYIVVVVSKETHALLPAFSKILYQLLPDENQTLKLIHVGDIDQDYAQGVSFEGMAALVGATHVAYEFLLSKMRNHHILIDITGGQKTTAIAGSAVALEAGRQFQYISTHDYQVRTYDVTYLGDNEG